MGKFLDLTNKRFGRLLVLKKSEKRDSSGNVYWFCQCDCGTIKEIAGRCLKRKHTISCGCYNLEHNQKTLGIHKYALKHNLSNSRLYRIWNTMKNRCYNPNVKKYKDYGGRGIIMCDSWKADFKCFYDWSMKNGYDPNAKYGQCTIDRINVDGNYCPENCRWVDMKVQANNKRKNKCVIIQKQKFNNKLLLI